MIYNNIDFNKKTILITGGAGFIGSNLSFLFSRELPQTQKLLFLTALEMMKFFQMEIKKALDISKI